MVSAVNGFRMVCVASVCCLLFVAVTQAAPWGNFDDSNNNNWNNNNNGDNQWTDGRSAQNAKPAPAAASLDQERLKIMMPMFSPPVTTSSQEWDGD